MPKSKSVPTPGLAVVNSVGRPYVTLGVEPVPGRGFILTMIDALAREIKTPTIPNESIARALEGSPVVFQHAGHSVEMTPVDTFIRVRCVHPGGPSVEGTFRGEDIERLVNVI